MEQYSTAGTSAIRSSEQPPPPVEPLGSINENSFVTLRDSNSSLDLLLSKVRGSQPSAANKVEKMPERHLLADARNLRNLASEIYEKAQELHRYIGSNDK